MEKLWRTRERRVPGSTKAGYAGPTIIDHEDRTFEGTEAGAKGEFLPARDGIAPFIR